MPRLRPRPPQAARAYDCAAVCFRGYGAELNFEEGDCASVSTLRKAGAALWSRVRPTDAAPALPHPSLSRPQTATTKCCPSVRQNGGAPPPLLPAASAPSSVRPDCAEDTTEEFIDWLRKGGKRGSLFAAADETEAGGTGAADGGNGAADSAPPPTPKPKPGADTAESGGGDGAGGCDGPPQPPPAKRVATGGDGAAAPAAGCGQAPPSFASSIRPVAPTVAQAYTSALAGGGVVAVATPGDDGEPVLVHSPRAPFHHSDERADASPRELGDSPSSGEGGGCGAGGEAGPEAAAAAAEGAGVAAAAAAEPPAGSPGAAEDEAEGCSPAGLCDVTQSERELVEALALSFMGQ